MTTELWRSIGRFFLMSLRIVMRPDRYWFRPWAIYAFRIMPLIGFMVAFGVISTPFMLAARLLQRLAAG